MRAGCEPLGGLWDDGFKKHLVLNHKNAEISDVALKTNTNKIVLAMGYIRTQNNGITRHHVLGQDTRTHRLQEATRGVRRMVRVCSNTESGITVIGGGVIGLTSALRLKQAFHDRDVRLMAENIAVNTTSEGAGGLWKPFALSGTPDALVNRWGKETLEHYMEIYLSDQAVHAGVLLTGAYELFEEENIRIPEWSSVVPGFRKLSSEEILFYDPSGRHRDGYRYETIVTEGKLYMQWILNHLNKLGVEIIEKKVTSIDEFDASEVVVNCTGLGARELVGDSSMYGIRGHVLRVHAPWVRHHVESHSLDASKPAYIIPNTDTIVLGGTKQAGNEDRTYTEDDVQEILDRCQQVVPSLKSAKVLSSWVGIRPGREGIRLELEKRQNGPSVIHNYGHGGSGLTLAWGCAGDVVDLMSAFISP